MSKLFDEKTILGMIEQAHNDTVEGRFVSAELIVSENAAIPDTRPSREELELTVKTADGEYWSEGSIHEKRHSTGGFFPWTDEEESDDDE